MGKFIHEIIKSGPTGKKHAFLPKIATDSKGSIGTCLASSFCERVNLFVNQVVTKVNNFLAPNAIDVLTTLRMNIEFMKFMRKYHSYL